MTKMKADKRLTPLRHIMNWLPLVAAECASNTPLHALEAPFKLASSELSITYPESYFTEESAKIVAMAFQFGWPTVVQMKKALNEFGASSHGGVETKGLKINLDEKRLGDPRLETMDWRDKNWIVFYDRRRAEIIAEGDPLFDHPDILVKIHSKRGNLASCVRQNSPKAWEIIRNPYQPSRDLPEPEFIDRYYGISKADAESRATEQTDPRRVYDDNKHEELDF